MALVIFNVRWPRSQEISPGLGEKVDPEQWS